MSVEEIISQNQSKLFALAYRMTGEVAVSEDIVQESLVHWATHPHEDVKNPPAYLAKAVTNRSLNHLAATKRQRELYKGTWLPEPIIREEQYRLEASLDVSYGLLLLLTKLTPTERVVYLLKESFDTEYAELADLLILPEANCRQLYHRAHQKMATTQKRFPVDPARHWALTQAFATASRTGNIEALVRVLNEDIVIYADGGGKATTALWPLVGLKRVTAFLRGLVQKGWPLEVSRPLLVNGNWGFVLVNPNTGILDSLLSIETDDKGISYLYFVRNPDKLPDYKRSDGSKPEAYG